LKAVPKKTLSSEFVEVVEAIDAIAKAAKRGRKSLAGDNFYGNKFDQLRGRLHQLRAQLSAILAKPGRETLTDAARMVEVQVAVFTDPSAEWGSRVKAKKDLLYVIRSQIEPGLGQAAVDYGVVYDAVIPPEVVRKTRGYIEQIAVQVNGNYHHGWYDGCAVMLRRLIETLIIECFEHNHLQHKIKNANGDYVGLADLIGCLLAEGTWHLGRNTKNCLPHLKGLGDQSAHSRRFIASKSDIDKVQYDARVAVEELVHLAGLRP
jgi:hypothetical protein